MGEAPDPNTVIVDPREGGQKLLQFLQRRLDLPPSLLHRWIRTGSGPHQWWPGKTVRPCGRGRQRAPASLCSGHEPPEQGHGRSGLPGAGA